MTDLSDYCCLLCKGEQAKLKPITHCLVKGSSPQGSRELPVCKKCTIDIDNESPYFWDANEFVELID